MRGTFGGWFEIEQPSRAAPAAIGVVLAAAFVSWLATLLWLIAAVLGAFLVLASVGLVFIRRYNRRETGRFISRQAVLAGAGPGQAVTAPAPAALTVNHFHGVTHLHFGAESADPRIIQAVSQKRDAITTEGNQES